MAVVEKILTKKKTITEGICILIENGAPCKQPVLYRGLCERHVTHLRWTGGIEEYALPRMSRKTRYEVNPDPVLGNCCVIENGFPCRRIANRNQRSLCEQHYQSIWQREKLSKDIRLLDFSRPMGFSRRPSARDGICVVREETGCGKPSSCKEPAEIRGICSRHYEIIGKNTKLLEQVANPLSRRKKIEDGKCVVQERTAGGNFLYCSERPLARGLCEQHYKYLSRRTPWQFELISDPPREKPSFRLKKELKTGICVVVENDEGCSESSTMKRRLCERHYWALQRAGMVEELTDQFIIEKKKILERKPEEARAEGFCIMMVDGEQCTNTPKRRGLCAACIWIIAKTEGYEFEQFALPPVKRSKPTVERKEAIIRGMCILNENGMPCKKPAKVRGLCGNHYKLAKRQKRLKQLCLTQSEIDRINEIPHLYFDKNVVIHFALHETFGESHNAPAGLVDAVLKGRIYASVSVDCIRALYSQLGHKLANPVEEGGKDIEAKEAERTARDYAGKLFFSRGGLWSFIPFVERHFELCACKGHLPKFSLEDALELSAYAFAKKEYGAALFVTDDRGILGNGEGVSSSEVVRKYSELIDPRYLRKKS